ncbi:MAG: glutamate-5-semialdehyde dehydrogenase [Bdellovibrionota bacterium]
MNPARILKELAALRLASRELRSLPAARKNSLLMTTARLLQDCTNVILRANELDLKKLDKKTPSAFRDRLTLNEPRIKAMAESLKQVAALPDPVGEVVEARVLRNGMRVKRLRSPLGVILMIFESRPNVAIEAFSLAFKSGNAVILRGGSESMRTTAALYDVLKAAFAAESLPEHFLWGVTEPDRAIPQFLLKQKQSIDVVVPRGGERLIDFVTKNSEIPVIKNDRGLCHVYVHEDADLAMARKIVINSKTQRPGVCNAMETLLVHEKLAGTFLPTLHAETEHFPVEWHVCPKSKKILGKRAHIVAAEKGDWDREWLELKMNCRIVGSLDEAIEHIETHGSRHSEVIVTESGDAAKRFESEVDAAAVYWNASTRFTDGFELGLGGELGISTQKLHVRGPVGLRELTSVRWILEGNGQIRE